MRDRAPAVDRKDAEVTLSQSTNARPGVIAALKVQGAVVEGTMALLKSQEVGSEAGAELALHFTRRDRGGRRLEYEAPSCNAHHMARRRIDRERAIAVAEVAGLAQQDRTHLHGRCAGLRVDATM